MRGDRYWGNVLDETESRIVEHRLSEEGVKIHDHNESASIIEKRGRVSGVITKNGEQIKCQMLAVAIGIRPRIQLGEMIGLQTDRGILVNQHLESTIPDIFVAGDAAQAYDPISGKYVIDSLRGPAREQGSIAGSNMAGSTRSYLKAIPFYVTRRGLDHDDHWNSRARRR